MNKVKEAFYKSSLKGDAIQALLTYDPDTDGGSNLLPADLSRDLVAEPVLAEYPPLSFELEEPEEKNELLDHMRQYVGGERAYFDWLREINKNRR